MTVYATVEDVSAGFRALTETEKTQAESLLSEAALIIDSVASKAAADNKKIVSCRMVRRAIGDGTTASFPMGSTQGSVSALGYAQSWTLGSGASGELYLNKTDRRLLGLGSQIGSYSPVEELTCSEG
ncbi:MAG: hypothetical protein ACOYJH_02965 [Anaerovoracaceae bacterium]|jgi:hypothetical protein